MFNKHLNGTNIQTFIFADYATDLVNNTAILIFTRTAHEEAQYKQFCENEKSHANTIIASALIKHAVGICRQTGIPYFTVFSNQQYGNTFGERLSNAIAGIFDSGFENIIAIGNDCLTLSASQLIAAGNHLQQNGVVLGPTRDGGVYLIGINKQIFDAEAIACLQWQSGKTRDSIIGYLETANISYAILPMQADVDKPIDLFEFIAHTNLHSAFIISIRNILYKAEFIFLQCKAFIYKSSFFKKNSFRSPPFFPFS